jgi:predicted nucleic acid-binding Zn ribbon protein
MRPKRKVVQLSDTIEKLLVSRGLASKLKEYRVFGHWGRAVGDVIAQHSQPVAIRGRKLTVVVDSSAWMQQLSLLRPEIIGKVNQAMGQDAVESITLRLGEVEARPGAKARGPEPPAVTLGPEDRGKIEQLAGAIADPDVRKAFQHLLEKDFRSRRSKKR